jgi:outer membrane lipoprotein-sorting protein
MDVLSDALTVMRLRRPWTTIHMSGFVWRDEGRLLAAWDRVRLASGLNPAFSVQQTSPGRESTEGWSLWRQEPDLMRVEFTVPVGTVTAVWKGHEWWAHSPTQGWITNRGHPNSTQGEGPAGDLIDPARFLAELELQLESTTSLLSRAVYMVRARPALGHFGFGLASLGAGADEYLLGVDAERGVLLRTEARLDGAAFRVAAVQQVAYDETIAADVFRLQPDTGGWTNA